MLLRNSWQISDLSQNVRLELRSTSMQIWVSRFTTGYPIDAKSGFHYLRSTFNPTPCLHAPRNIWTCAQEKRALLFIHMLKRKSATLLAIYRAREAHRELWHATMHIECLDTLVAFSHSTPYSCALTEMMRAIHKYGRANLFYLCWWDSYCICFGVITG